MLKPMINPLKPGTKAPDFTLKSTPDQTVSLSELKGKPVVILFYPADFSPVCGDEVSLFNNALPIIKRYQAEVIGISVDNIWCHIKFEAENKLHFPLLSDFHPKGKVSKQFGVYDEKNGEAARALFVIDKNGNIAWSYVSPTGINPGVDGVLASLKGLSP